MKLANLVALVTGASQGLGKAIAEAFVREGANVAICARDAELITAVKNELQSIAFPSQKLLAVRCDVTSPSDVSQLFSLIDQELGKLDILVNTAGVLGQKG